MALSFLFSLKRLQAGSLAGLGDGLLDAVELGEIELSDADCVMDEELLGRLAPVRVTCGGRTIEVGEEVDPELGRFTFDGATEIPTTEALDLTVIGNVPKSFPISVRIIDLSRANATRLSSVRNLPFLRRLVVPAVLECVGEYGISSCPRLAEVVFGEAPLRELGDFAFEGDVRLEHLSLPAALKRVDDDAFHDTSISSLDAGECGSLETLVLDSVLSFCLLVLPGEFSGNLRFDYCKSVKRATFGAIGLEGSLNKFCLTFGEVRFAALGPPRGGFIEEMVANAFVFGERAQLLKREATVARPP
jgi:hypothetical protein